MPSRVSSFKNVYIYKAFWLTKAAIYNVSISQQIFNLYDKLEQPTTFKFM